MTDVAGSLPTDGNPIGSARIAIARRGLPVSSMQKNRVDVARDAARERACSTRASPEAGDGVSARNRGRGLAQR